MIAPATTMTPATPIKRLHFIGASFALIALTAFALLGLRLRLSMVRALIDINAQRLQVLARSPRLCTDDLGFPGITGTLAFFHNYGAVAQPLEHGARRDASWEGLSPPRARNPLFRRISPLFRLQRRFSVNTLNLQQFWREELRRTGPFG